MAATMAIMRPLRRVVARPVRSAGRVHALRAFASDVPTASSNEKKENAKDAATTTQSPVASASSSDKPATKDAAKDASSVLSKPMKNLRDVMEAIDILVEEAEKKVEKKYRPNMIAEFKQLNDTDGKVLVGASQLIAVDKARSVPSLEVKSLTGKTADMEQLVTKNGKHATLIVSSFKNFGLDMLPAWREPFQKEFASHNVQVLTLNVIEDWYMKLVQGSIVKGLQDKTPEPLHDTTYAHFGRCDPFRTALDLYNSFVGYAHLVDSKGRVRWIAGGPATPEELKRLSKVTRELLVQQKQSNQRRQ